MNYAKHKAAVERAAKAFYAAVEDARQDGFGVEYIFPSIGRNTDEWTTYIRVYEKTNSDPKALGRHYRQIASARETLFKALKSAAKRKCVFCVTCNGVRDMYSQVL